MLRAKHFAIAAVISGAVGGYLVFDVRHDGFRPAVADVVSGATAGGAFQSQAFKFSPAAPAPAIAGIAKLARLPVVLTGAENKSRTDFLLPATVIVIEPGPDTVAKKSSTRTAVVVPAAIVPAGKSSNDSAGEPEMPLPVRAPAGPGLYRTAGIDDDAEILLSDPALSDLSRQRAALKPRRSARISRRQNTGSKQLPAWKRRVYRDPFSTSGQ